MLRSIILLSISVILLFSGCDPEKSTYVEIQDPNLLLFLRNYGFDRNHDGNLSVSEASLIESLYIEASDIRSIHGIETFTNLDTLVIRLNYLPVVDLRGLDNLRYLEITSCELEELDLSDNLQLRYIDVAGGANMSNRLDELDISNNTMLEVVKCNENRLGSLSTTNNLSLRILICGRNRLDSLDVSNNLFLEELILNNNLITRLELSNNRELTKMISCGNQLSRLDLSNNQKLVDIGIDNMPSLHEVCVWTLPFPPAGISILMDYSPNIRFSDQCEQIK